MKKLWGLVSVLFVSSFIVYAPAHAQSSASTGIEEKGAEYLLFEDLPTVSSAGFFKTKATLAPGSTIVVNNSMINDLPVRDLTDVINYYVPSMSLIGHEYHNLYPSVRGIGTDLGSRTVVMLDNTPIVHRWEFGYGDAYQLPLLGNINSVEVISGPGAIMHGSGALSGFINMVPKNGKDFPGFFANVERGFVEDLWKEEAGYGMSYGQNKNLYLYAGLVQASGVKVNNVWNYTGYGFGKGGGSSPANARDGVKAMGFKEPSYKLSALWNHEDLKVNLLFQETNREWGSVSAAGQEPGDQGHSTEPYFHCMEFSFAPSYTLHFTDTESFEVTPTVQLLQSETRRDHLPANGSDEAIGGTESHYEIQGVFRTTRLQNHSLAVGILGGKREFKSNDAFFHAQPFADGEFFKGSWYEAALFAEDIYQITEKWLMSLGARYDKVYYNRIGVGTYLQAGFDGTDSHLAYSTPHDAQNLSWRWATSYEIDPTLIAKLSFQQGFRYPDIRNYLWHNSFGIDMASRGYSDLLNNQLKPEKMDSLEFNLHKDVKSLNISGDLNWYYNTYRDMLMWSSPTAANPGLLSSAAVAAEIGAQGWLGTTLNCPGKFRSTGMELIGRWQPIESALVTISYAFSKPIGVPESIISTLSQTTVNGNRWIRYPNQEYKLIIDETLLSKKLIASLAITGNSGYSVSKTGGSGDGVVDGSGTTGALKPVYCRNRLVVDAAITYNITKNFSTKLAVKNLLKNHVPYMTWFGDGYYGDAGSERQYWYLSAQVKF